MKARQRQTYVTQCRTTIAMAGERLEMLRRAVERRDAAERVSLERMLDTLRGRRNRAMARVESAHQASDEAWPFARAGADQAIAELASGLDELEARLDRAAA
ncbi:hypothetical protein [Azospirillum halopraeferens]|uniref:hypothetical protein n=1 Tax=Azospirillum halopraeferens TaxID=34010 RepID=UPI0003F8E8F7|nr:hypothetical protein [Azospirillum halopraeferens]